MCSSSCKKKRGFVSQEIITDKIKYTFIFQDSFFVLENNEMAKKLAIKLLLILTEDCLHEIKKAVRDSKYTIILDLPEPLCTAFIRCTFIRCISKCINKNNTHSITFSVELFYSSAEILELDCFDLKN